jgi:hypothetical protein
MDTSRLPEPLRRKLEARLALLPAAYRATISGVRKPEKADEAGSHYNRTVQRGDPPLPAMGAVLLALLGIAVITWRLGWWSF